MDTEDKERLAQAEANSAQAVAIGHQIVKQLERLLEVVGEQPSYSGVSTNGDRDR